MDAIDYLPNSFQPSCSSCTDLEPSPTISSRSAPSHRGCRCIGLEWTCTSSIYSSMTLPSDCTSFSFWFAPCRIEHPFRRGSDHTKYEVRSRTRRIRNHGVGFTSDQVCRLRGHVQPRTVGQSPGSSSDDTHMHRSRDKHPRKA